MEYLMPPPPTYHRQRALLLLLDAAGGELGRMDFQKLMFLYGEETGKRHYDFVPYKYGCYSFLANDDLTLLARMGWIRLDDKKITLTTAQNDHPSLSRSPEKPTIQNWLRQNPKRETPLVREVYKRFPYYAIHSEIANALLSPSEQQAVHQAKPKATTTSPILYTIGYEGIAFEAYANKLIQNRVALLCDVRNNPLSRKYGFSKGSLSNLLPKLGIAYRHLPELGIESGKRKHLNEQVDYDALFLEYEKELPQKESYLAQVLNLLQKHQRIAITCFEKQPHQCHRHCISDFLAQHHSVEVKHL